MVGGLVFCRTSLSLSVSGVGTQQAEPGMRRYVPSLFQEQPGVSRLSSLLGIRQCGWLRFWWGMERYEIQVPRRQEQAESPAGGLRPSPMGPSESMAELAQGHVASRWPSKNRH